jgi:predicted DNA-binding protein
MTLILNLPPEREQQFRELATRRGAPPEKILEEIIEGLIQDAESPDRKRVAGLHRGAVSYISEEFDAPLPESFWLGDNENPL